MLRLLTPKKRLKLGLGTNDLYVCASQSKKEEFKELITDLKSSFSLKEFGSEAVNEEANVLLLGGDGSLNHLINHAKSFGSLKVIYIPCGTANDFNKTLRLNMIKPSSSLIMRIIENSPCIEIPIMACNDRYFLNVATAGEPATITESDSGLLKDYAGTLSYYLKGLSKIISPEKSTMYYSLDQSNQKQVDIFGFAVVQGLYAGGGVKLSPGSSGNFRDTFEFTFMSGKDLKEDLAAIIKLQDVESDELEKSESSLVCHRAKELSVWGDESIPLKLDGEKMSAQKLTFKKSGHFLSFYYY